MRINILYWFGFHKFKRYSEYARCHQLCDVVKLRQGPCTCGCAKFYEQAVKIANKW